MVMIAVAGLTEDITSRVTTGRSLGRAAPAWLGGRLESALFASGDPFDDFDDDDFDDEFDDDFEEEWDDDLGDDGFGPEFQEDPEEDDDKFAGDPDFDK